MHSVEKLLKKDEELKELRKEEQRIWGELSEIARKIMPDQLKALGYEKAKEVSKIIFSHISGERKKEISEVLRTLELSEHPESEGAVWYPDINEIPELSAEQKHVLDEAVVRFRVGEFINLSCPLMQRTGLSKAQLKASAAFLAEKGVLKKYYHLCCQNCSEEGLFDEEDIQKIFDEEKTPYCMECDEEMFPDKEELKAELSNGPEIIYRVEKQPKDVAWRR